MERNQTKENDGTQNNKEEIPYSWFISVSEIAPGASAIIGGNRIAFYAIHHIALWMISASIISSGVVILNIYSKWKRFNSKLDFPIRFPLYLAVADMLWGISHFIDHMYLLTVQKFPDNSAVMLALSVNLWIFFGYQQLMHASVAGYTYLRVVHERKLPLGKWEWKLHLLWFSFLALSAVVFALIGSFGNTGYWMGYDVTSTKGLIVGIAATLTCISNAITTTLGYRSIRSRVDKIKNRVSRRVSSCHFASADLENLKIIEQRQRTESQCLTTYVYLASSLYCPFAILWCIGLSFQIFMNVVGPVTCLFLAILANCSGCANAYGYFYNERLKKQRGAGGKRSTTPFIPPNISFASSTSSNEL